MIISVTWEVKPLLPHLFKEAITVAKKGKKYQESMKLIDRSQAYAANEAIDIVKKAASRIVAMSFCEPRSCRLQLSS